MGNFSSFSSELPPGPQEESSLGVCAKFSVCWESPEPHGNHCSGWLLRRRTKCRALSLLPWQELLLSSCQDYNHAAIIIVFRINLSATVKVSSLCEFTASKVPLAGCRLASARWMQVCFSYYCSLVWFHYFCLMIRPNSTAESSQQGLSNSWNDLSFWCL